MYNMESKYYIAKFTKPRKSDTRSGLSKNPEYLQIEGVPCKVISSTETNVTLNPFTSNKNKTFTISKKELKKEFTKAVFDRYDNFKNLKSYKKKINKNEFDKRDEFNNKILKLNKIIKTLDNKIQKIFKDKIEQIKSTQGSMKAITIKNYNLYKNNNLDISANASIGDPIFNRNSRWCPPVNITHEEFTQTKSYPLPIGIRPKDYCLPSELWNTTCELFKQIFSFKNIKLSKDTIKKLDKIGIKLSQNVHKCKYCNQEIDINKYSSNYKSQENYIEICHRDPNERFIKKNMYWGHGECNRRQGGYSETNIMNDGIRLMLINNLISQEEYHNLIKKIYPDNQTIDI